MDFKDEVNQNLLSLAVDILNTEDFEFIESVISEILRNNRETGIAKIRKFIGMKPKRPIYYLNMSLRFLPEGTRDVVRYTGDYIDQLMKQYVYEHTKLFAGIRAHHSSLSSNIKKARKFAPLNLLDLLKTFDEYIYLPAKHHWDTKGRDHLFSAEEAIIVCLIMQKLAKRITEVSPTAAMYSRNEIFSYF